MSKEPNDDRVFSAAAYYKPFHFYLSPLPEYRSMIVDAETRDGVAMGWDDTTEPVHVENCADCAE